MLKLFKYSKGTSKKKEHDTDTNIDLDIRVLMDYVLKKLDGSKEAKKLSKEVKRYNALNTEDKLQQFPHIYFRIEGYFTEKDSRSKDAEASRIRHLIRSRLTRIKDHSELHLLFIPQHEQETLFCKNLLSDIIEEAIESHGVNFELSEIQEELSQEGTNDHQGSQQDQNGFREIASTVYEVIKELSGEDVAINVFQLVYKRYFDKYHLLDTFSCTISILPSEVYEAANLSVTNPKELNKLYHKHIRKLERENQLLRFQIQRQTELKESHQESEHLKSAILHNTHDAYFLFDENMKIKDWNRQAEKLFGWTFNETVGRSLMDFVDSEELRNKFTSDLLTFHRTGKSNYVNNKFVFSTNAKSGQEIAIEASLRSIKIAENFLFSVFVRDITPKKIEEIESPKHSSNS